jgi:hypothetical protein
MQIEKPLFLVLISFLTSIVLYCAVTNSITHDEAYTWFIARYSLRGAMLMEDANANNHILNTIFVMLFSDKWFGAQEWAVRMGALFGFFIYVYAAYYLSKSFFKDTISRLLGFAMLFANPYLMEFFSLGRGYSLSIGLMLLSLYHFQNTTKPKHLWWAFGAAALGVYANFTLLPFFLSLTLVYFIQNTASFFSLSPTTTRAFWQSHKPVFIVGLLLLLFIALPIYQLKIHKQLYYGGEVGLWSDTIKSLAEAFIYEKTSANNIAYIAGISSGIFGLIWLAVFYNKIKNGIAISHRYTTPLLVFTIVLFILSCLFYGLGTHLVIYRTALFLYPLFVLAILSVLRGFDFHQKHRNWRLLGLIPLVLALSVHTFIQKKNSINSYRDWQFDAETRMSFPTIYDLTQKNTPTNRSAPYSPKPLKVDIFWIHGITFSFYCAKNGISDQCANHYEAGDVDWSYSFFLIEPEQFELYKGKVNILKKMKYYWLVEPVNNVPLTD